MPKPTALLLGLLSIAACSSSSPETPYAAETLTPATDTLALFEPGNVSTDDIECCATFTPDGDTIYFSRRPAEGGVSTIMVVHRTESGWSSPEVASFSGSFWDGTPSLSPDGQRLFFQSGRPPEAGGLGGFDIWVVEREGEGWGEPRNVGPPVSTEHGEFFPSVTASGTLYFGATRPDSAGGDIYRSVLVDGRYQTPTALGPTINTPKHEWNPYVSPDETLLIFTSLDRTEDAPGGDDLYVSRRENGAWGPATLLAPPFSSSEGDMGPSLSPDRQALFLSTTRRGVSTRGIYSIQIR